MKVFNRSQKARSQGDGEMISSGITITGYEITGKRIMEKVFDLPFGIRSGGIQVVGVNKKVRERNTG